MPKRNTLKEFDLSSKPREKGMLYGFSTLTNAELLAILLRTGNQNESALQLAQKLLDRAAGRIEGILSLSLQKLSENDGVGLSKAATICACAEIARRLQPESTSRLPLLKKPQEVASYVTPLYQEARQEILRGLYLDTKKRLLRNEILSIGGMNFAYLSARELFVPALEAVAETFVLVHNHPSGDPTPSPEDRELTHSILKMGKLLKIELLDHLIIGREKYYSFAEEGML